MRGKIKHNTDVTHAIWKRAQTTNCGVIDATKFTRIEATFQFEDCGIIALDVTNGEDNVRRARPLGEIPTLINAGSNRLFKEDVDLRCNRGASGFVVIECWHSDHDEVRLGRCI